MSQHENKFRSILEAVFNNGQKDAIFNSFKEKKRKILTSYLENPAFEAFGDTKALLLDLSDLCPS